MIWIRWIWGAIPAVRWVSGQTQTSPNDRDPFPVVVKRWSLDRPPLAGSLATLLVDSGELDGFVGLDVKEQEDRVAVP